jgi:hypothetical protein
LAVKRTGVLEVGGIECTYNDVYIVYYDPERVRSKRVLRLDCTEEGLGMAGGGGRQEMN